MRLLLDTHTLLWWLINDPALSRKAHQALGDAGNEIWVSAVSAFEVSTKFRLGKLPQGEALVADFKAIMEDQGFAELPMNAAHAIHSGALAGVHRDPFDRILIGQALVEDLTLVSNEKLFDRYGVRRLW